MSVATFFKGVRTELKHVTWPTRQQTITSVVFVIVASLVIAYYLGLLDAIFQYFLKVIVNR